MRKNYRYGKKCMNPAKHYKMSSISKNRIKTIAFYLPQFHRIPENDKWWGTGFTEWTNVKKSKPLFKGHYQPRVPLANNYYDLSEISILRHQSEIAQKYYIDGFCYYHYWFNGKKLLEKPIEAMLNDKSITMPFCFSWANEPWTRTWDGLNKEILIDQNYGNQVDWEAHINYLIPFFKDERYIHINNHPVLLIYRTASFSEFDSMIELWNKILKGNSIKSLYIIETLNIFQTEPSCKLSSAVIEFEPSLTIGHGYSLFDRAVRKVKRDLKKGLTISDYDFIWKKILGRKKNYPNKKSYFCAFPGWDNSPRRGSKGLVIVNFSPEKFGYYFGKLLKKSSLNNNEFLFINAWNEWAEGAYIEPDEKYGMDFLESIKNSVKKS